MQYFNNPRQTRLIDLFENIFSPLAYRQLKSGWQHLFRETVLELMPVGVLKQHFNPIFGQPTKELDWNSRASWRRRAAKHLGPGRDARWP